MPFASLRSGRGPTRAVSHRQMPLGWDDWVCKCPFPGIALLGDSTSAGRSQNRGSWGRIRDLVLHRASGLLRDSLALESRFLTRRKTLGGLTALRAARQHPHHGPQGRWEHRQHRSSEQGTNSGEGADPRADPGWGPAAPHQGAPSFSGGTQGACLPKDGQVQLETQQQGGKLGRKSELPLK